VTTRRWLREGRSDLASDRILDAAAQVFVRQGVARTSMADVAREAGCSRATLYRYFDDRPALRTAFVHRETRKLAAEVAAEIAAVEDETERVVEAIMLCVSKVRARPTLHAWFATDNVGITRDLIASSAVIEGVVAAFLGRSGDPEEAEWMVPPRGRWSAASSPRRWRPGQEIGACAPSSPSAALMALTDSKVLLRSISSGNSMSKESSRASMTLTLAWEVIPRSNRSASPSKSAPSIGNPPCSARTRRTSASAGLTPPLRPGTARRPLR